MKLVTEILTNVPLCTYIVYSSTYNPSVRKNVKYCFPLPLNTAPDDYSSVSTTLTFLAGADGSRPSDAVCVSVPIIDDQLAEDTESVIFNIASLDEDRIEIDPTRSQKILYIEDNDGRINIYCSFYFTQLDYQYC